MHRERLHTKAVLWNILLCPFSCLFFNHNSIVMYVPHDVLLIVMYLTVDDMLPENLKHAI